MPRAQRAGWRDQGSFRVRRSGARARSGTRSGSPAASPAPPSTDRRRCVRGRGRFAVRPLLAGPRRSRSPPGSRKRNVTRSVPTTGPTASGGPTARAAGFVRRSCEIVQAQPGPAAVRTTSSTPEPLATARTVLPFDRSISAISRRPSRPRARTARSGPWRGREGPGRPIPSGSPSIRATSPAPTYPSRRRRRRRPTAARRHPGRRGDGRSRRDREAEDLDLADFVR